MNDDALKRSGWEIINIGPTAEDALKAARIVNMMNNDASKQTQGTATAKAIDRSVGITSYDGEQYFHARLRPEGVSVDVYVPKAKLAGSDRTVHITIEGLPLDIVQQLAPFAQAGVSTCVPAGPVTFFLTPKET